MERIDFVAAQREHASSGAPAVGNLLDVDFYKFTMLQHIHARHREVEVVFALILRDATIPLGGVIDMIELEKSLDHARSLKFKRTNLSYLRGMDVYGRNMFSEDFLAYLRDFQLPPYTLEKKGTEITLTFKGKWVEVTLWETIALAIVSELYYRSLMRKMPRHELEILYARAMDKIYTKLAKLQVHPGIRFADFGQRRRHSFLWQKYVIGLTREMLGDRFTGTSNTYMAFNHDLVPIGTNAHELPMVYTAKAMEWKDLARNYDIMIRHYQYAVLQDWEKLYGDGLRVMLPDTYGSEQFFANAPEWLTRWRGFRQDSGDPISRGELYISWLNKHRVDPREKLIIFSDGLDVDEMVRLEEHFRDRIKVAFGWGTNFTNDFRGCAPRDDGNLFRPFSMVCKVVSANGRPCVKLSDNIKKATGPKSEIARYLKIFGSSGRTDESVLV